MVSIVLGGVSIYLTGLFLLICFSYLDIKYKEVDNIYTYLFFALGLCICIFVEKSLLVMALMLFTGLLGAYMWKKKIIGGADFKILPAMIPFMLIGSANYIVDYMNFLIVFGCVGASYGLIYKEFISKKKKKTKYVPFVPVLAITYLLFAILYLI